MSVADQFRRGQQLYQEVTESSLISTDPAFQSILQQALTTLLECRSNVHALALFSDNETLEDISTGHLQFMLVEAYLAELTLKQGMPSGGAKARLAILETSTQYLREFLNRCDQYGLLDDKEKQYIERVMQGAPLLRNSTASDSERLTDATRRREEKIARYRQEQALREQVKALQVQLEQAKVRQDDGEELDRSLVTVLLQQLIQQSSEHLQSIQQEREMLDMMVAQESQLQTGAADDDATRLTRGADARMPNSGPLLSATGKPLRPFVIVSKREQLQQGVFRQGWRMPTMTIDEYLEQEHARGNVIEGGGPDSAKKTSDDEDNGDDDEQTYKAREWDEFKDDNRRGWGNRAGKG